MMMYDDLVKRLREHQCDATEDDTQEFCEECSYDVIIADKNKQNGIKAVCVCGLMNRAADAIEELNILANNGEATYEIMVRQTSYIEELQKKIPRWIPVTERLPEAERKSYWVCTDTGYQCECRWTNNLFGIIESDEYDWSIFDIPQYQKVVAWRILPEPYEPPKEET